MITADPTAFCWTGGPDQTDDPTWIVRALQSGDVWFTGDGTPRVRLHTNRGQTAAPGAYLLYRNGVVRVAYAESHPSGCTWCGRPLADHGRGEWHPDAGLHAYTAPTDAERLDRMLARRAARTT